MTAHPSARDACVVRPTRYRITVGGRLSERLASSFDGFAREGGEGETALVGFVRDQAQLYGVLDRIRSLGLELRTVEVDR
jgi:hypothetical protein